MNSIAKDGSSEPDDPGQSGVASPQDRLYVVRGPDRRRRESAEAANLREGGAQAREGEARVSDEAAPSSEQETGAAESVRATPDHLAMMQEANAHLVIAAIEAHRQAEQAHTDKVQMDHLAHHDVLTGLPNRMLLQDRLSKAIELARRQGKQLAVMFMDLDRFKLINDSLGHVVGDRLLQSVARRLVDCVRQSDTISRQGGDEFVLLLPSIERAEDAAFSAQKILAVLAQPYHIGGNDLDISGSIGISIYPDDGQDAETLIKSADTAMYYAKENGRNRYTFFEQSMNARVIQRQSVEASLRLALERQEFVLHYQPKINLRSHSIVGVEAFIRWQRPEHGMLLPGQFIPVAEDCGLILQIGRWVLREACLQAQAWRQAGLPEVTIAVNTSAVEFRAPDFLDNLRATLADAHLESHHLELELTENVLMRDAEFAGSVLYALADLGVKLAVDDFGTGCSSLSYLRKFPIDTLKIDQSFVSRMTSNPEDASIVSAVIGMGRNLQRRVIAEGVETREQFVFLMAQHCDEGQGYFFGPPMTAEALATLLRTGVSIP
jgi:diguanylate cyclase (GGDEF)-like protein